MASALCPYCKQPVLRDDQSCEACKRALVDHAGNAVRDIDVPERWNRVVEGQSRAFRALLIWGTPVVALLCLVSPFATGPLHFLISAPVLTVAHGLVLYKPVISAGQRLLGRRRRFIVRTTRRLFFYPLALFGYMSSGAPLAGAVIGAATFAGLTALVTWHTQWGMRLEKEHRSLTVAEKVLFSLVFVLALLVIVLIGLLIWGGMALWSKLG
jgi:hypothetical protein